MHHYHIISASPDQQSITINALDAHATLNVMVRASLREAHIYENGHYAFTARQATADGGSWLIHTLPDMADARIAFETSLDENDFQAA